MIRDYNWSHYPHESRLKNNLKSPLGGNNSLEYDISDREERILKLLETAGFDQYDGLFCDYFQLILILFLLI